MANHNPHNPHNLKPFDRLDRPILSHAGFMGLPVFAASRMCVLAIAAFTIGTTPVAMGQSHAPSHTQAQPQVQPHTQTHTRSGLGGVRMRMPNVLGSHQTLPIQRQHISQSNASHTSSVFSPYQNYASHNYYDTDNYPYRSNYAYSYYSGSQLNAQYDGNKLSLNLHLGADPAALLYGYNNGSLYYNSYGYNSPGYHAYLDEDGRYRYAPNTIIYTPYYPYGGYGSYGIGIYRPNSYYGYNPYSGPIDGTLYQNQQLTQQLQQLQSQLQQQRAQQQKQEPKRTTLEQARYDQAKGDLAQAITAYRNHLDEDNEDVKAMRDLAFAMLEAGRLEDGAAMLGLAYHTDPLLARSALDLKAIGFTRHRYDRLLGRVMSFANRTDSGSSWLAGLVLLQSNNKTAGASRVLLKARRAGLSPEIADAFERELGIPAHR